MMMLKKLAPGKVWWRRRWWPTSPTWRTRLSTIWAVVAVLLVWVALVAPARPAELQPTTLLRLPLEGLVLVGVLLVLPARARRPVAAAAGLVLGLLCLLKVLDLGFWLAVDRPFNAFNDGGYADSATSLLFDSVGTAGAVLALLVGGLAVLGIVLGLPLAVLRVNGLLTAHRAGVVRTAAALLAGWTVLAVTGASAGAGAIASASDAGLVAGHWRQLRAEIADERRFDRQLAADPRAATPPTLAGLRGKDVLLVFVESYGRFALEGPSAAPVTAALDEGTQQLAAAGFHVRSGFLTSPTFGGVSWLAHSTLQTGLWVDSQSRYDRLLGSGHSTLTGFFGDAGWRTVLDIPSSDPPWPEGQRLYGFDRMYGAPDVGYAGPPFGYARIPDQYTLQQLYENELAATGRGPVMAEVDLVSSHTPWAPLPRMMPWELLGNGTGYWPMLDGQPSQVEVWSDTGRLRTAYATSIAYSLRSLVGFLQRYGDDDLVTIVLGDHQPNSFVTGQGAGHDVPISVIARDPAVIRRIEGWGWEDGLRPSPDAPVSPMNTFRGRFLAAFEQPLE